MVMGLKVPLGDDMAKESGEMLVVPLGVDDPLDGFSRST